MVLVPLLFYCSPLGVTSIRGVTNICDNHKGEEQKYKRWHSAILCYCIPNTLLARDARNTRSFFCETRKKVIKGRRGEILAYFSKGGEHIYSPRMPLPLVGCREPYAQKDIPSCFGTRNQSPALFCVMLQVEFILAIR